MKLFIYILLIIPFSGITQNSTKIGTKVNIISDVDLDNLIDLHIQKNEVTEEIPGFRIQISSNNDRSEIYALRAEVASKVTELPNYVQYDQPYYRLKIGDFKTRLEARSSLEEIIILFPSAFIVSDDIKIK
jgi:hypothetical protein